MAKTPRAAAPARYRWAVASRAAAGVCGGYGCAVLTMILLARTVPAQRAQALSAGMMSSFALWIGVIIWAFAARSAVSAWSGVGAFAAIAGGLVWLVGR